MQKPQKTFYVVDAHGFLHRFFHALPRLTSSSGEEVGALFGFTRLLLKILREKHPDYIAVCFDSPAKTFRHKMFADYKANRPKTDEALVVQLAAARALTEGLGIKILAVEGYEADDLIACAAYAAIKNGAKAIIASSDKDAYQLVQIGAEIWPGDAQPPRGSDFVFQKYGIEPGLLTDYFALMGDSSDNIPGVAGIGPKTAAKLVSANGSLEEILKKAHAGELDQSLSKRLLEHEEDALLSKKLVTLDCNYDIGALEEFVVHTPDPQVLAGFAKRYEFIELLSLVRSSAVVSTSELPKPGDWKPTIAQLSDAKEFFFQAQDGCVLIGLSPENFAFKPIEELTASDRASICAAVENPAAAKIGHYFKEALRAAGITIARSANIMDIALAAWCVSPSRSSYDFIALAVEYADIIVPTAKPRDTAQQGLFSVAEPENLIIQNIHARKLAQALSVKLTESGVEPLYREMEMPLIAVLARMESVGIAVDTAQLQRAGVELAVKMERLQSEINVHAGSEINVNSPKQIASFLFEKLGLQTARKIKTGFSTDEESLSAISAEHPAVNLILEYREAAKLKSTYVDSLVELARGGRVHTRFDQTGTATGRLSSLHPNLQNIPVRGDGAQAVRRAFAAREGCKLLSADYSQIDLRVLAHESGDKALVAAFNSGGDIHARTAADVFGVSEQLVTADMRRAAKTINFGIVYGQGATALAAQLAIPRADAQKHIDHYFETYSGIKKWMDEVISRAARDGFVRTLSGRLRYLPEISSPNAALAAFAKRAAVNTIIQGGSSDIIKKAMLGIDAALTDEKAVMVLQVHDELLFEIPEHDLNRLAPKLKELMEKEYPLKIPLLVDVKTGANWSEMTRMEF